MAHGRNPGEGGPARARDTEPRGLARLPAGGDPFDLLHERMDRIFRDVLGGGFGLGGSMLPAAGGVQGLGGAWSAWPAVDVSYDPERVHVSADLPGMDEKDVHLEVDRGRLVLRGEKKEEKEEKGRDWARRERSYGSFERVIPLPDDVVPERAEAHFQRGVLTVDVPRQVDERNRPRQIPIRPG